MVANFYWSIILKIICSSEQGLTNRFNLVYTLVYTSKNLGICMCTNTLFVNGFPPKKNNETFSSTVWYKYT